MNENEKVLDSTNWRFEALAVINDIKDHVKDIDVSDLQNSNQHIFLNLTTLEGIKICIELSGLGFRLVGKDHNCKDVDGGVYYETPYSLLSTVSPSFHESFANALVNKLKALSEK